MKLFPIVFDCDFIVRKIDIQLLAAQSLFIRLQDLQPSIFQIVCYRLLSYRDPEFLVAMGTSGVQLIVDPLVIGFLAERTIPPLPFVRTRSDTFRPATVLHNIPIFSIIWTECVQIIDTDSRPHIQTERTSGSFVTFSHFGAIYMLLHHRTLPLGSVMGADADMVSLLLGIDVFLCQILSQMHQIIDFRNNQTIGAYWTVSFLTAVNDRVPSVPLFTSPNC